MVVMVGGPERSKLHQIDRRWAQGRLVVAMGRIRAWGVVAVSVGGPHGPWWVVAIMTMQPQWWGWGTNGGPNSTISEGGGQRVGT